MKLLEKEKDILNIVSKKDLMDKRDLSRLLDYYRVRVENFDRERNDYIEKIEELKIRQEDYHKMEWQLKKREEEILELQNLLSHSNNNLNKERQISISYKNEVESAKIKSMDDRRRLLQLLQLSEPLENTLKYYSEKKPKGDNSNYIVDPNIVSLSKNLGLNSLASKNTKGKLNNKKETLISCNNEEENTLLREELEICQDNSKNLKIYYENHLKKVEEDRRLREEEWRLQAINFNEKLETLLKKNQKLETINLELTKDLLQMKFDMQNNSKTMFEEIEMYKIQNETLSDSLNQLTKKIIMDKENSKNDFDKKTNDIAMVFRNQVKNHEENINIIKEQYKQIQKIYNSRIEDYEKRLKNITEKYRQLEFKRNNEIEGFINENNLIRKRMKSYEDYIYKLKQFTNGGINIKKLDEINSEISGTENKFTNATQNFKKSLDSFKSKLVNSKKNNNNQSQENFNDQKSEFKQDYEDNRSMNELNYNEDLEMI